jgi:hypothetical protein
MTVLLEQALRRVESLAPEDQDAIASQLLDSLDDDAEWSRRFHEKPAMLRALAEEAREEHSRGDTRPVDELAG